MSAPESNERDESATIYLYRDGEVQGPFQLLEAFEHWRVGTFATDDLACLEGTEEWQPLGTLLAVVESPATVATTSVPALDVSRTDKLRWLTVALATFALLGACTGGAYFAGAHWYKQARRLVLQKRASEKAVVPADPLFPPYKAVEPVTEMTAKVGESVPSSDGARAIPNTDRSAASPRFQPAQSNTARPANVAVVAGPASSPSAYLRTSFNTAAQSPIQTMTRRDLFQTPWISPEELSQVLEARFSTALLNPPPNPADAAKGKVTIEHGSFILETPLRWNPRVEVIYSIPLYNNATPLPRASNVVMLGFYPHAMAPPTATVVNGVEVPPNKAARYGALDHYAKEFGFTAFTMFITTENFNDPVETYFLGGSEWTDVVFRAQDELTRRHRLPPRKLLLEGMSLGATFVERIAAARPERVAAVAFHSAPEITVPKTATDTLWYMQITRGDSMQAAYNELYNGLLKLNDRVLFDVLPPDYNSRGQGNLYHSESQLAKDAADAFLDGFATRRNTAGNVDPVQWPYARRRSNPLAVLSKTSTDFARLPPQDLELLPSAQFVHCIQDLPARVQAVNLPMSAGRTARCYVGLPPLGRARGVLIYAPETAFTDITNLFDNVYFLAQKGYVVLCPYARGANLPAAVAAAFAYQQSTPALKGVPTVLVGAGESGRCLWEAISHGGVEPKAVALIDFKPQQTFDETHLPVGARPIRCPVFFIEEEKRLLSADTALKAREILDDTQKIDAYVGLCRDRHQLARIVLVPDTEHTDIYDAQKSVEAVNNAFEDVVDGRRGFIVQ